jgi:hypothetical protein
MVNPVLAAARSEGHCEAMQITLPRNAQGQPNLEISSHPDTYLLGSDGTPYVCRICWGEEDDEAGKTRSHPI